MSDLFNNVKPGDMVHYKTPQGQHGKGKVVLRYDTHVVVNRGKGQPQVVNDKNYVKHERGGKVIGALLSRLKEDHDSIEAVRNATTHRIATQHTDLLAKHGPQKVMDAIDAVAEFHGSGGLDEIGSSDISAFVKHVKKHLGEEVGVQEMRNPSGPYGGDPYDWDPTLRKAIFASMAKKVKKLPGSPQPSKFDTGRPLKSAPAPFRRGTNEGVSSYVRKVKQRGLLHVIDPAGAAFNKMHAKADVIGKKMDSEAPTYKKSKTQKQFSRVVGVMRNLHHKGTAKFGNVEEDSHDLEGKSARVAKTKKHKKRLVAELDNSTLASYVSKAIADRKKAAAGKEMAHRIHTPERAAYFDDKLDKRIAKRATGIKKAVGKIANNLPHEPLAAHSNSEGARHGGWSGMEARESEWMANQQLASTTKKPAKGHYLMRDGRRLSGPHSPEDAVKQYKSMSDSKGVKIVHVKEGVEYDVTSYLMETTKVKKAAEKAISLAKKAKGNKHVETEPKLETPRSATSNSISDEGSEDANALKV